MSKQTSMSSVTRSVRTYATAGGRLLPNPLRCLLAALMVTLAGCATQERAPDLPPPIAVPESTWWQIDSDIRAASLAAKAPAQNYARDSMERWKEQVRKHTEANFIPWFSGYWTQQWLAIKVAWYKLSAEEGTDPAVKRLADYLQEQYQHRVLDPVAKEIDPDVVRGQATKLYVQRLGEQLQEIPQRYAVPFDQFDRRIKDIPAITLAPDAVPSASLYQIVHADPITKLPAYVALNTRIRNAAGGAEAGPSDARISPVAKRTSEGVAAKLAISSGAGAVAAAVGGIAGMMISLGGAGFGAITHENERRKMETQLRGDLNAALDDMWLSLLEDPAIGVMAEVYHMSEQIEGSLAKTLTRPAEFESVPREVSPPGEQPPQNEK